MKAITFNSPKELQEKVDVLLEGYMQSVRMAKADLKKAGIPYSSTKYAVSVDMVSVSLRTPQGVHPDDFIKAVLKDSTMVKLKHEKQAGVHKVTMEQA